MALLFFFFSSNLWSIYASMLFYVSHDHHHFSYGKGSSKLQIFTLPHTDPARLFCRKSLRCATNKSTKNLGCASAILSILVLFPIHAWQSVLVPIHINKNRPNEEKWWANFPVDRLDGSSLLYAVSHQTKVLTIPPRLRGHRQKIFVPVNGFCPLTSEPPPPPPR